MSVLLKEDTLSSTSAEAGLELGSSSGVIKDDTPKIDISAANGAPEPPGVRLLVELIGTLVLSYTVTVGGYDHAGFTAISVGSMLMVLVYAGGYISGGHYNPALTIAYAIRGAMDWKMVPYYMAVQLVGAFIGGGLGAWISTSSATRPCISESAAGREDAAGFISELFWTFALVTVHLHCFTAKQQQGNSFFGLAIGFTVLAGTVASAGISGGTTSFNPALALALPAIDGGCNQDVWIYMLAECLGAAGAAVVFVKMAETMIEGQPVPLLTRCGSEFIGTFFLCFQVALTGPNLQLKVVDGAACALGIGSTLMVMIYALGYVSGGHFNPQVSLAAYLTNNFPLKELPFYWFAQMFGGFMGAGFAMAVVFTINIPDDLSHTEPKNIGYPSISPDVKGNGEAFFNEMLYSAVLSTVVLHTACSPKQTGNQFYGLAIGFTVVAGAIAGGSVSGGAYNPAVGFCLPLVAHGHDPTLSIGMSILVYVLGDLLGGILAAAGYNAINRMREKGL